MKRLFMGALWAGVALLAGCAACTTAVSDGTRTRVPTPCGNKDVAGTATLYDISWDRSSADYPVTYRAKLHEYQASRTEQPVQQGTTVGSCCDGGGAR